MNFFGANQLVNSYYNISQSTSLNKKLAQMDISKENIHILQSKANPNLQQAIQEKLRMTWTYHSNAIEGNTLTLGDTIFFLREGLTVSGKPLKDHLETKNHAEAIDYLYDIVTDNHPIDPFFLRSMNNLLLKGIDHTVAYDQFGKPFKKALAPGEYKKEPNYVVQPDGTIHQYVEPFLVEQEINDMCQWIAESKYHPVITASIAHYNMVRIHPFQDGNGRCARLLMNLILMKHELTPAIIEVEKRQQYIESLKQADDGDLTPFTEFVADATLKTQTDILDAFSENNMQIQNK